MLPYEFPNNSRLRILENWEMLGKFQNSLERERSTQCSFQQYNARNSGQKKRRRSYQSFLLRPNFAGFAYFVSNILSRIVASS